MKVVEPPTMMLSYLIEHLTEHLATFGDMPVIANRTVYPQVDTHTENLSIYVHADYDDATKAATQFSLYIEGE